MPLHDQWRSDASHRFLAAGTLIALFVLATFSGILTLVVPPLYEDVDLTAVDGFLGGVGLTLITIVFALGVAVVGGSFVVTGRMTRLAMCLFVFLFGGGFLTTVLLTYLRPLFGYFSDTFWVS